MQNFNENLRIVKDFKDVNYEIIKFFENNDEDFFPPIKNRIEIPKFIELSFLHKGFIILYEIENTIVGLAALSLENPNWQYYIHYLAVNKLFRSNGIGLKLIQAALYYVKREGGSQLFLTSWSTNLKALRFYNRIGFIVVDKILNDRSNDVHTYIFVLSLIDGLFLKPINGFSLIIENYDYCISKALDFLINLDKDRSILPKIVPFILVNDKNLSYPQLVKFDSSHSNLSHVFNLTYFPQKIKLFSDLEEISLYCFCLKYLRNSQSIYLFLGRSTKEYKTQFDFGNVLFLNSNDQINLEIILDKIESNPHSISFLHDFLFDLIKSYPCDGFFLAEISLSFLFEFNKIFKGFKIFDAFRDFAICVESNRMKSYWINNSDI